MVTSEPEVSLLLLGLPFIPYRCPDYKLRPVAPVQAAWRRSSSRWRSRTSCGSVEFKLLSHMETSEP